MKTYKRFTLVILMLSSFFMTGCDIDQIANVIQNVAQGVQQAIPAVTDAIGSIQQAFQGITGGPTAAPAPAGQPPRAPEQPAGTDAGVITIDPGAETPNVGGTGTTTGAAPGSTQQQANISRSIRSLIGSTNFRGPEVNNGRLACAQVVSTALVNAGVLSRVQVNCDRVVEDLRAVGWRRVNPPPYQDGDVVTWTTSRGPGRHIGIIVREGNRYMAISNRNTPPPPTPRMHDINYLPITQVLRSS